MHGVHLIPLWDYFMVRHGPVSPLWSKIWKGKILWNFWKVFSSSGKWQECLEPPFCRTDPRLNVYMLCLLKKPILRNRFEFKKFIWGAFLGNIREEKEGSQQSVCLEQTCVCWGPLGECIDSLWSCPTREVRKSQYLSISFHEALFGHCYHSVSSPILPACFALMRSPLRPAQAHRQVLAMERLWIRVHWKGECSGIWVGCAVSARLHN